MLERSHFMLRFVGDPKRTRIFLYSKPTEPKNGENIHFRSKVATGLRNSTWKLGTSQLLDGRHLWYINDTMRPPESIHHHTHSQQSPFIQPPKWFLSRLLLLPDCCWPMSPPLILVRNMIINRSRGRSKPATILPIWARDR